MRCRQPNLKAYQFGNFPASPVTTMSEGLAVDGPGVQTTMPQLWEFGQIEEHPSW